MTQRPSVVVRSSPSVLSHADAVPKHMDLHMATRAAFLPPVVKLLLSHCICPRDKAK